jgi:hypothetical protein
MRAHALFTAFIRAAAQRSTAREGETPAGSVERAPVRSPAMQAQ